METKIVYVLVSEEADYYYEMLLLSLYSLRIYHPKDIVEIVMDDTTYWRLVEKKAPVLDDVTPIVVSIPSEYTQMQRSRYLKTRLRQIVKGDFLFLDGDTLICDSLKDIDKTNADIAMVPDGNRILRHNDINQIELCEKSGFGSLDCEPYYNSGVVFCRDCHSTDKLYESWHYYWRQAVQNGVSNDQPALCQANSNLDYPIQELNGIWNYQLLDSSAKRFSKHSKILHYWYVAKSGKSVGIELLLGHIKQAGFVTEAVAQVAKNPRTTGHTVFTISDEKALQFFFSDFFYAFDSVSPLYKFCLKLYRRLIGPVQALSRIKQSLSHR